MKTKALIVSTMILLLSCSPQGNEASPNQNPSVDDTSQVPAWPEVIMPDKENCIEWFEIDENLVGWNPAILQSVSFSEDVSTESFNTLFLRLDTHNVFFGTLNDTIVVNDAYFSDLQMVSAIFIADTAKVGSASPKLLQKFEARDIFRTLLESGIVETFVHLNSEICLESEVGSEEKLTASYKATHYYCTNECDDDVYQFKLTLDKKNGEIWVTP